MVTRDPVTRFGVPVHGDTVASAPLVFGVGVFFFSVGGVSVWELESR